MKTIDSFCYWSRKDGKTLITHSLCGGNIKLFNINQNRVWICAYCGEYSDKLIIQMKQEDNTIITEAIIH